LQALSTDYDDDKDSRYVSDKKSIIESQNVRFCGSKIGQHARKQGNYLSPLSSGIAFSNHIF
jgi:hypothetical protein